VRQLPWELAVVCTLLAAAPAAAQQGSVQVTGAAQAVSAEPERLAGESRLEPDFAILWYQPRRVGALQAEFRGTRRGDDPHLGRAYFAFRDFKYRGAAWDVEAGDFYFAPTISDYRFTNLSAPFITLAGASVAARGARSNARLIAGRTTVWRNIFGSDPDSLDQQLALGSAAHRFTSWLDVNARASSVRTQDVKEFAAPIAASDQAGVGARLAVRPSLFFVADGAFVS
jgi:hypothetical protein